MCGVVLASYVSNSGGDGNIVRLLAAYMEVVKPGRLRLNDGQCKLERHAISTPPPPFRHRTLANKPAYIIPS